MNTISMLDPGAPTWQTGFERRFNKRWAAGATIGLPFYVMYPQKNKDSLYHRNFKLKVQAKYYFGASPAYIALEGFRTSVRFNNFNGEYSADSGYYRFQSAHFKKHIYGVTVKFGSLFAISPKWWIEPAMGYGIRFVNTSVQATGIGTAGYSFVEWFRYWERIGPKITPHMAYEAKFAYRL